MGSFLLHFPELLSGPLLDSPAPGHPRGEGSWPGTAWHSGITAHIVPVRLAIQRAAMWGVQGSSGQSIWIGSPQLAVGTQENLSHESWGDGAW